MGKHDNLINQLQELRVATLVTSIDDESVENLKGTLTALALRSDEPIVLIIDSPGGSVLHGFSLTDYIMMLGVPVVGIVTGFCASMAVPVLQACAHRWVTEHSVLFLHALSTQKKMRYDDDYRNIVQDNERIGTSMHDQYVEFVARRAKKPRKEIDRICKQGDRYGGMLFPKEALEWGLIDKILPAGEFKLFTHTERPVARLNRIKLT